MVLEIVALSIIFILLGSCDGGQGPIISDPHEWPLTFSAPSWSSRGMIVYRDHGSRDIDGFWAHVDSLVGLWTYDLTTKQRTRVSRLGSYPSWSPDGSEFVYWPYGDLWIYSLDTNSSRSLMSDEASNISGEWSPCAGSVIYASSEGVSIDLTIWAVEVVSGNKTPLTPGEFGLRDPVWYAGCDSFLYKRYYVENNMPKSRICLRPVAGGEERVVLDTDHDERSLAISPGEEYISYHSGSEGGENRIYIYDRGKSRYIAGSGRPGRHLAWAPDGNSYVYVARAEEGQSEANSVLIVVDLATGESRVLF